MNICFVSKKVTTASGLIALIRCAVAAKHTATITPPTGLLEERVKDFKNMTDKDPRTYANRHSVPWNEVTRAISKLQERPQVGNDREGKITATVK